MQYSYHNSIIITVFLITILYTAGFSSDKPNIVLKSNKFNINLVGHVSKTEDIISNESILNKFWDILAGREEQKLIKPFSVLISRSGAMYILDQGACKIQVYNPRNNSSLAFHFPEMVSLVGLTMLADSSVIFSDSRQSKVFRLYPDEDASSLFIMDRILEQPTGLACNPVTGNVWVVETAAHRLSVFDQNGNFIRHIGTRGSGEGQFNYPTFICIDQSQRVYVVDAMNHRIQILDLLGEVISNFGQAGDGSGDLARPKGIAFDSYGHIYVVDALFHNVQIFDLEGNYLEQFGRQGRGEGEFWMPSGIAIDRENRIYVADTYNSRIQIFQLEIAE